MYLMSEGGKHTSTNPFHRGAQAYWVRGFVVTGGMVLAYGILFGLPDRSESSEQDNLIITCCCVLRAHIETRGKGTRRQTPRSADTLVLKYDPLFHARQS